MTYDSPVSAGEALCAFLDACPTPHHVVAAVEATLSTNGFVAGTWASMDPALVAAVERTAQRLEALGHHVEEVTPAYDAAAVGEAFGTLHDMVRSARSDATLYDDVIHRSVEIVVLHVREHRDHMRFLARERYGGVRRLPRAIAMELELFANELAVDLSRVFTGDKVKKRVSMLVQHLRDAQIELSEESVRTSLGLWMVQRELPIQG